MRHHFSTITPVISLTLQGESPKLVITMPTDGVVILPSGKKTFICLENNADVFTGLAHDLGLTPALGFYDVYSLDEPSLLSVVPRPAHALIFITPGSTYYSVRGADGTRFTKDGLTYEGAGPDEPVMWFRQTIGNACGLMALVHSMANGEVRASVQKGSLIDRLLEEATPLKPDPRADVLYNSVELEEAHMRAARRGDSAVPAADDLIDLHFIAFVKGKDGHLWELEGASDGPIDRGLMKEGDDMLSEQTLKMGVKKFLDVAGDTLEFSVVAMAQRPT